MRPSSLHTQPDAASPLLIHPATGSSVPVLCCTPAVTLQHPACPRPPHMFAPPPPMRASADFAAEHGITCDIEKIPIEYCNQAMVGETARAGEALRLRLALMPTGWQPPDSSHPSSAAWVQERMEKNDVRYRFVLDIAGSLIAG